jgi:triphosphatase
VDDGAAPAASLEPWARKRLRQRHRSLLRHIRTADLFDAVERHQVRIEAKKLRYALDFLASLWPPERLSELTEALVQAQDLLGQMNDRVSAQRLLASCPEGRIRPAADGAGRAAGRVRRAPAVWC